MNLHKHETEEKEPYILAFGRYQHLAKQLLGKVRELNLQNSYTEEDIAEIITTYIGTISTKTDPTIKENYLSLPEQFILLKDQFNDPKEHAYLDCRVFACLTYGLLQAISAEVNCPPYFLKISRKSDSLHFGVLFQKSEETSMQKIDFSYNYKTKPYNVNTISPRVQNAFLSNRVDSMVFYDCDYPSDIAAMDNDFNLILDELEQLRD